MDDEETQLKPNPSQSSPSSPNNNPDSDYMTKQSKSQDSQIREKSLDPESNPDQDGETGGTRLKITFKMSKSASKVPNDTPSSAHHTIVESRSYKRKKAVVNTLYDNGEAKSPTVKQAEEFASNLSKNYPSFMKTLVRSNCSYGYWMHIPMRFCKMYMPKHDTRFLLENDKKETYVANYIAERSALSGGWKAFATVHNLNEGDVLVFHLIEPSRFKVYVVKPNDSVQADGGFSDNQLDSGHMEKSSKICKSAKNLELAPVEPSEENGQMQAMMVFDNSDRHVADQSENDSQGLGSDALEVTRSSGSIVDFEVKSIDDFTIVVNGVTIDSELSDHHRTEYYELCRSQNSFLHDHLLNSINYKLAAEIIAQTVNIAEAVRASNFFSSQADYAVWDKTLKGFELLGMNVGFLRARLNRLITLSSESEEAKVLQKCREVELEKARTEEEMRSLQLKISELKESVGRLDSEMENLKVNVDRHELMFQNEVNAPW